MRKETYQIDQKSEVFPVAFYHLSTIQEVSLEQQKSVRPPKTGTNDKFSFTTIVKSQLKFTIMTEFFCFQINLWAKFLAVGICMLHTAEALFHLAYSLKGQKI